MEIGRVAQIDNSKENYDIKAKQVSTVEEKMKTIQEEEYKKNASKDPMTELNEVILDNVQFGYNKKSRDFFVKVTRGEAEYKYPTEDMMKVKAYLLEEFERNNKI
ncbi:flagellin [Aliarcobacter vitoriensis]|uniref:Flagellin n=1 Tax=Aliarcobacter vitoriensis TaxID=2011099 RepID=A0A366MV63_9BACT|nr:flagellin [Aliarcobacter vitoriensis]RBQ29753.1 flagellin [Aliarcobacter vitoriensis]RBQ31342.1 flagellin [Arcobacter sp. FW59]